MTAGKLNKLNYYLNICVMKKIFGVERCCCKHSLPKDYNSKEVRKVMRLCALGMVTDDKLEEKERVEITKIVINDYLCNNITDFEELTKNFDKSLCVIDSTLGNNMVKINYGDCFSVTIDTNGDDYNGVANKLGVSGKDNPNVLYIFARARLFVEKIVTRLESPVVQQSLFVNVDTLDASEVKQELSGMIGVIKADRIVAEQERAAFMAVAKIMGVRISHADFERWVDSKYPESVQGINLHKLQENFDVVADAESIKDAIVAYKIQGPLRFAMQNVLKRKRDTLVNQRDKQHKKITKWALGVFALSALLIYFGSVVHMETKNIVSETYFKDQLMGSFKEDYSDIIVKSQDDVNAESIHLNLGSALNHMDGDYSLNMDKIVEESHCSVMVKLMLLIISGVVVYGLIKLLGGVNTILNKFDNRVNIPVLFVTIITTLLLLILFVIPNAHLEIYYMPFWTMCMMISIEVMIFMRERYSTMLVDNKGHKDSTKQIVVFVLFAIIADFCIGYIELPKEFDTQMLIGKFASAILLGSISFFVGKFLDTNSIQRQTEIDSVDKSIATIESYLPEVNGTVITDVVM